MVHNYENSCQFYNVDKNQRKVPRRTIQRTTEFCASGKRPAFIGVESERDKTGVMRG